MPSSSFVSERRVALWCSARGSPRKRPQLFAHHPAIIAAALYRDFGRNHDDASVLVIA